MADVDSIYRASSELEESILFMQQSLLMARAAVPANAATPPWLFVLARLMDDVDDKAQAYQMCVHEKAIPIVRDFANAKGGMGVITPMSNQKVHAGNSANSRG